METRVMLVVAIDDESGNTQLRVSVSKWNEADLVYNSQPFTGQTIAAPIRVDQSTYPYAVAVLRDSSDRVVAAILEKIARGETLLMVPCHQQQLFLRVATGPVGPGRP